MSLLDGIDFEMVENPPTTGEAIVIQLTELNRQIALLRQAMVKPQAPQSVGRRPISDDDMDHA